MKGRWGWRQMAALCVSVWIMAACDATLPTLPLSPLPSLEATLILRTAPPSSATPQAATVPAPASVPTTQTPSAHTPESPPLPQFYTVVPGDTLEGIAARFGVSVSALQEANGGLPPARVIPGQVLLIPPPLSGSALDTPTGTVFRLPPTWTPLPVLLSVPDCFPTPADETICLGWVQNPLSAPLAEVVVQVILRDPGGRALAESSAPLLQALVPPGEGAPYVARFRAPPPFALAEAALLSAAHPDPADELPVLLRWANDRGQVEADVVQVAGMVRHDGDAPVTDLLVVIALLDDTGHVTGVRALRPAGTLTPGEALPIETLVAPLGPGTTRYQVYAEGWPQPAEE